MKMDRRAFVMSGVAAMVAARYSFANPLGLPLGLQLYSVREQMAQDMSATFAAVAAAGFTQVEAATLPKRPVSEIRAALDAAGLTCVGSHHSYVDLAARFDELMEMDAALGAKYMICASPGHATQGDPHAPMTLEDWRFTIGQLNRWGEKTHAQHMGFGYHNHVHEFEVVGGAVPYEEMLKRADPTVVMFELDCGWARVAGRDPVAIMQKYPHRFSMLHVKDFHLHELEPAGGPLPKVTELGRGDIDYRPVMAQAAKNQSVRYAFVEQEGFDMPWQDSLKVDAEYMRGLK